MNRKIYSIIALCAALAFLPSARAQQKLTKADIDRMMTQLSNWGRWGKDDQLGTLNLITPTKRKEAAALVKEGFAVSLAHDTNGAVEADNPDPFEHTMKLTGADPTGQWSVSRAVLLLPPGSLKWSWGKISTAPRCLPNASNSMSNRETALRSFVWKRTSG